MDRPWAWIVAGAAAIALSGCFGLPLHKTDVDKVVNEEAAAIFVGETDRSNLRQKLGEPLAGSEYWRFDLFRLSGSNVGAGFILLPYPIPFVVNADRISAWLLVQYDGSGKVTAHDRGVTHSNTNTAWEYSGSGSLRLEVAETMSLIVEGPDKPPFMVVWPAWRDAYLSDHASRAGCTVVAGCGPGGCRKGLAIDVDVNEPPSDRNVPLTVPYQGLFLLSRGELAPGTHLVRLMETTSGKGHRVIASSQVDCAAGEVVYLSLPDPDTADAGNEFAVSREIPEAFQPQTLLIWRDGQWLVPQEPGR